MRLFFFVVLLGWAASGAWAQMPAYDGRDARVNVLDQRVSRLESRVDSVERKLRDAGDTGLILILFGAVCALWAQNTGRSGWLWFFFGFVGSLIAVLVMLAKNSGDMRRRRLERDVRAKLGEG